MTNNSFFQLSLTLLFLGGCFLKAQEVQDDKSKKMTGRLTCFVATSIPEDLENPVSVLTGKKITPITLSSRLASQPVEVPSDGIVRIVRQIPNPKNSSQPAYLTLAQAIVPEGVNKSLVILGPIPKKDGSDLVFNAKVQNLAEFKGGDYMFINLTTLKIAVQLGQKKIGLRPGETSICDGGSIASATNAPVSYHYLDETDDQWKMISASTVVIQPTRREMCIFNWDTNYNRVDYKGITVPVSN